MVATAPVVAVVTRISEPEVMPVPEDTMYNPTPVVRAVPEILIAVPALVESAITPTNPWFEVEANAPVAWNDTAPFVAIAPVVPEVAKIKEPEVSPVPVEATRRATEVVAAVAEMFTTVAPVVTLFAITCNNPALDVDV